MFLFNTKKKKGAYACLIIVQVVRAFSWCEIVGKRFPICHVHMDNSIVEVCPCMMLLLTT